MRLIHSLCSSHSSPPKWKIPEEKKWININYKLLKTVPKNLIRRMMYAPLSSYYKAIGIVTLVGVLGCGVQFFHAQYKIRTSDYSATALKTLEKFPQLTELLGTPLKSGHTFPYVKNGLQDDEVYLGMPLSGNKSSGVLFFHAVRNHNIWVIRSMKFMFTDRAGGSVRLIKDPNNPNEE